MASAELCSEKEIVQLTHGFYENNRKDEVLGPIFNRHVREWNTHLSARVSFWFSRLRSSGLSFELFQRWLVQFCQTADALPNAARGKRTSELATRIAQRLRHGYPMNRDADKLEGVS